MHANTQGDETCLSIGYFFEYILYSQVKRLYIISLKIIGSYFSFRRYLLNNTITSIHFVTLVSHFLLLEVQLYSVGPTVLIYIGIHCKNKLWSF